MEKTKSQKVLSWTTKDIAKTVAVYLINAVVITLLFFGAVEINLLQGIIVGGINTVTYLHFAVLLGLILAIMAFYFAFEERDFLHSAKNSEMIFLIIEISLIVCSLLGTYVNIYLRPLAFAAILTLFVSNRRTAQFINVIFCLLVFMFDSFSGEHFDFDNYPVLIMGFSSGIIGIFCLDKVHSRLKLLARSLIIAVPTLICITMSVVEKEHIVNVSEEVIFPLICGVFSGPVAAIILMITLPIFEAIFRKISYFKYSELTDHKATLIKRMIKTAPGTFNHAIVVSNIAEACAAAIGEDSLLARTCAYYHDIGKLRRPEFFKENQADGHNPHDDLTPELSVNIIKSHAQDGKAYAEKHRLPKEIADVCVEHHGTLPILYFYDKAKKFTDGEVDIMQFCYPGPKPTSKISAIIMIADGCEAAARSLQDRSRDNVTAVVRKIVNERMALGQFEDCEITLKELNIIIHTVVNNLTGIYHSRIEYPKVNLDGVEL